MLSQTQIHSFLRKNNAPFILFNPIKETSAKASFCGMAGFYKIGRATAVVYIDDKLNRYFRIAGRMYECSNSDILRKTYQERQELIYFLSGIID